MGRLQRRLAIASLFLLVGDAATSARADDAADLAARVSSALSSGSASSLSSLFAADRKVAVTLDKIAELRGYVGAGPLVEAMRRYLGEHSDVRFDTAPAAPGGHGGSMRVKGTLVSRDRSGQKERVGLVFSFERIDGAWRAVEVRETG
jgi:hypothetical protein